MSDTLLLTDFEGIPPADVALAVAVYHRLDEHYPGHQWRVTAEHEAGIVTIQLLYLDVERKHGRWGYVLKIERLKGDPTCRAAIRAGGELLERFGLPRRRADGDAKQEALANGLDVSR